jgi:hypothetical protein
MKPVFCPQRNQTKTPERKFPSGVVNWSGCYGALQHFVSALPLPLSHLTAGLQHAPSLWQQVEQPVVIRMPAAKTAASISVVFMFVFGWFTDSVLPIAPKLAVGKFLFPHRRFDLARTP